MRLSIGAEKTSSTGVRLDAPEGPIPRPAESGTSDRNPRTMVSSDGDASGSDLRDILLGSQGGDALAHGRLLVWIAARARARMTPGLATETVVQDCLRRAHAARGTYQPSRCPQRWADGVIDAALAAAAPRRWQWRPGGASRGPLPPRKDGGGAALSLG